MPKAIKRFNPCGHSSNKIRPKQENVTKYIFNLDYATLMVEKKNYPINEKIKITLNINYFQKAQYLINIGERSGFFYIANGKFILFKKILVCFSINFYHK